VKQALHTAIAEAVARRLGWPDPEAVGRGAALPDDLEFVFVDSVGTRFLGNNLSCCTHLNGYCLGRDKSLGKPNLPNHDVMFLPGVWPEIPLAMEIQEPLTQLLRVHGYSHAFDEMTFPRGSSYGDWLEACYHAAAESHRDANEAERERRLGVLAGMCCHYVQDYCVPQHLRNEMLAAHAETEAQALRRWEKMPEVERMTRVRDGTDAAPQWSARGIMEAAEKQIPPKVSRWSCRRRKVVEQIITKGIACTAAVLKHMRPPVVVP
jgi:hypothetical protein